MPPWLSVLIPAYNVAPWLEPCLQSVLSQDLQGVEVIVLDDASTDSSHQLARRVAESSPNLRILRHAVNSGLSTTRNHLLAAATGDYVWFLDGDDRLLPDAVAALRRIVQRHQPDLVLCDYHKQGRRLSGFTGPRGRRLHDRDALIRGVFSSRHLQVWSKVTRRALWGDDLRFPTGRLFEDAATTPWLLLRARSYFAADAAWVEYRVRPGSIMDRVSRTRERFDAQPNLDLAHALQGFVGAARHALGTLSPRTEYAITRFCSKEFTKIGWRLLRARFLRDDWPSIQAHIRGYLQVLEGCAPTPFIRHLGQQLWRGHLLQMTRLALFQLIAGRQPSAGLVRIRAGTK